MTQARFPSLVGLRLRAFGAKPPSEQAESYHFILCVFFRNYESKVIIHHYEYALVHNTYHTICLVSVL